METIDELFRRDPFNLKIDDPEFERVIERCREARKFFKLEGKAAKPKKEAVTLADLGL